MSFTYWHAYLPVFLSSLATALPWLGGGLLATGILGFSPFGRALAGYLHERRRSLALTEELNGRLEIMERSASEVLERLDATEHYLRQAQLQAKRPIPAPEVETPRS